MPKIHGTRRYDQKILIYFTTLGCRLIVHTSSIVIRHERYSYKADVYSYALVILQIFTRKEPFDEVDAIEAARLVAIEERRPRISSSIPRIISELIEKCWADPPSSRPSFESICEELSVMRPLFTCHGSVD